MSLPFAETPKLWVTQSTRPCGLMNFIYINDVINAKMPTLSVAAKGTH